jgi:nitrite reductase (NADH) small subunit
VSGLKRVVVDWPSHNTVHVGDELYFCLEREGAVYLIRSRCPHRGGPLHLGRIGCGGARDGRAAVERLRCPWHGNNFRVDRLCDRGAPTVRSGSRVVAYLPAPAASPARQIVLAT